MAVAPTEPVGGKPAREVTVKCSPAERVVFYGPRWRGRVVTSEDGPVTEASFVWTDERYVRAEVVDERGRVAWTNAIFLAPGGDEGWRLG